MTNFQLFHAFFVIVAAASTVCAQGKEKELPFVPLPRFFPDIVVGFEESAYSIAEGESLEICVTIISPDDIGSTRVFLEVIRDEDAAENTASKS